MPGPGTGVWGTEAVMLSSGISPGHRPTAIFMGVREGVKGARDGNRRQGAPCVANFSWAWIDHLAGG